MHLARNGHEDVEPAAEVRGKNRVAADAHVEGPVAGLLEAVRLVAVGGVNRDAVAAVLEGQGHVEDQTFGAAYAEVRVDDGDFREAGAWGRHCGIVVSPTGRAITSREDFGWLRRNGEENGHFMRNGKGESLYSFGVRGRRVHAATIGPVDKLISLCHVMITVAGDITDEISEYFAAWPFQPCMHLHLAGYCGSRR